MDFKIKKNKGYIRWENRKEFLGKEITNGGVNQKNAILFVTMNNEKLCLQILNKLINEENKDNYEIIIVDQNSKDGSFEKIINFVNSNNRIKVTLLQTIDNIGGGGGYALGLEYILSKNYEYVIITEDDAIPLQTNTISQILEFTNQETYIIYNELSCPSFSLHFHGYPIDLIKKAGVLDPRYFMRSDDLEWGIRINNQSKISKIERKILNNLYYSHPVIKKGSNKFWQIYLGQRNTLYTISRWKITLNQFIIIFFYLWFGLSKYFVEYDKRYIFTILISYMDFILHRFGYEYNKIILNKLFKEKNYFYKDVHYEKISIKKFNEKYGQYFADLSILGFMKNKIKYSNKLSNIFNVGIIMSGFTNPMYPIYLLSKECISIEEIDGEDLTIYKHKFIGVGKYIKWTFSFVISILIYIFILPILIIRIIIGNYFKL